MARLKKILVGASAVIGLGATVATSTANSISAEKVQKSLNGNNISQNTTENNTQKPSQNPFSSVNEYKISAREVDGTPYRPFLTYKTGIDPKTYGMYYVRRGTHKRTNI